MSLLQLHNREFRVFALVVIIALLILSFVASADGAVASSQRRAMGVRRQKKIAASNQPRVDYAKFSHQTHVVAQNLACDSCHRVPSKNWKEFRKGDAAFPDVTDFPEHASCLNCHRRQFFARERPAPAICSNCHVAVTPRDTTRWLFPSLGDVTDPKLERRDFVSEFGVEFPHDKHLDVVGLNGVSRGRDALFVTASLRYRIGRDVRVPGPVATESSIPQKPASPKSCPVCHETYQPQGKSSEEYVTRPPKNLGDNFWLKKGAFQTIPNSHSICFLCHSADSGIAPPPKDCNGCHKLLPAQTGLKIDFDPKLPSVMGITDGNILARWSRRTSAGAFRHEGGEHPDLNCLNCHNVANATFSTIDAKTWKVPLRSCGGAQGCHITTTADEGGALNFELDEKKKNLAFVCTKCHVAFGKEAVPADHSQAIPTAVPKKQPS